MKILYSLYGTILAYTGYVVGWIIGPFLHGLDEGLEDVAKYVIEEKRKYKI